MVSVILISYPLCSPPVGYENMRAHLHTIRKVDKVIVGKKLGVGALPLKIQKII
jgi:hypothetical protein